MMRTSPRFLGSTVLLILGVVILQLSFTNAFLPSSSLILSGVSSSEIMRPPVVNNKHGGVLLRMSKPAGDDNDGKSRLRDLGYSDDEIERSTRKPEKVQRIVRVDMVDGIDAATLTAVGFGLIAFNFFVLANMGDGGIGAIVATIINSF